MDHVDVGAMFAAALRVEDLAAVVRARRQLVATHAASLRSNSSAAGIFFACIDEVLAQVFGCGARLDELAESIRARAARLS